MIEEVKLYLVKCDSCGVTYPHRGVNDEVFFDYKTALNTCTRSGWVRVEDKMFCPDCKKEILKHN